MKFSDYFVKHWQLTALLFLMLAAIGFNAWKTIPRSEDPVVDFPGASVVVIYPGASPKEVEQQAVKPLEDRLRALEHVRKIQSHMGDGVGVVYVEFEIGQDPDKKRDEVTREVNAIRAELPPGLATLDVVRNGPNYVNIVEIALVSATAPYAQLEDRAKALKDRIEKVTGVMKSQTWAYPPREVDVSLDLGRLAQLHIAPSQVLSSIGSDNMDIPGGTVDLGCRKFNVKTSGSYESLDQIRNTVIAGAAGKVTLLRDVADVQWGYADATHIGRVNGQRAVWVTANQDGLHNIQEVRNGIYKELDAFEPTLPPGMKLDRGFDQSRNVSHRLAELGRDFAIAILLVLVTLLPLGWRASGIVMLAIPLSLALGLALLDLSGFTLNQLSIVGFVIALGLLVDDSIVVAENIARFLREGHTRQEAAILATRQIALAILGCTATLVLAFVPLVFLPGGAGMFIRSMPLAVIYTVVASLLVALTIIPWLGSVFMREEKGEGNVFMRALHKGISVTYAPVLHRVLQKPRTTLAASFALIIASFALVPVVGFSLFPKAGTPQFMVDVQTPDGSSLAETDSTVRFVERVLATHPQVKTTFANVGHDNPMVYYNVIPRENNPSVGQVFALLDRYDTRQTPAFFDTLRAQFASYPNAKIRVREFENGMGVKAIEMRITGPDLDTLRMLAAQVENVFTATPGTMYVDNPLRMRRTDLQVAIDRQKAGILGVPTAEIDRTVRLGLAGLSAGTFRESNGEEREISVRLPRPATFDRIYLASMSGAQVPLKQVADVRFVASEPAIDHYGGERMVLVTSNVATGFNTDRVTQDLLGRLRKLDLPNGYRITAAGEVESRQEAFGGIGNAIIVAVFAILGILVLEFGSFRSTLIVASVIPLGIVGGIIALLVTGNTLSFTATIGFVALIGIEIKTSILLVDFTNQLREQGVPLEEAIQKAGEIRFVPIVLTTLTAIGGLLPLALENSAFYSPLAWVVIGGLVSSTLLARLVTPVVYKLIPPETKSAA